MRDFVLTEYRHLYFQNTSPGTTPSRRDEHVSTNDSFANDVNIFENYFLEVPPHLTLRVQNRYSAVYAFIRLDLNRGLELVDNIHLELEIFFKRAHRGEISK